MTARARVGSWDISVIQLIYHDSRSTARIASSKRSTCARISSSARAPLPRRIASSSSACSWTAAPRLGPLEREHPDPEGVRVVLLERLLEEVVVARAVDRAVDALGRARSARGRRAAGARRARSGARQLVQIGLGCPFRGQNGPPPARARPAPRRAATRSRTSTVVTNMPAPREDLDQLLLREPPQRLAHRRAADPEPLDELRLAARALRAAARASRSARGARGTPGRPATTVPAAPGARAIRSPSHRDILVVSCGDYQSTERMSVATTMPSSLRIAQEAKLRPITEIAAAAGLEPDELEPYGRYKGKVYALRPRSARRPARRQADQRHGDHADEGRRGQDDDVGLADPGTRAHRQEGRALPARGLARPGVRDQGRRRRRRLRPGRADGGHEPPLHRRHPRDRRREQPARGDARGAPPARQRARHRSALDQLAPLHGHQRPLAARHRGRARRQGERLPAPDRLRHHRRVRGDGDRRGRRRPAGPAPRGSARSRWRRPATASR